MVPSPRPTGWVLPASCHHRWKLSALSGGAGLLLLEGLVQLVNVVGRRHRPPWFRGACAEVFLESMSCQPLWAGKEWCVVASAMRHGVDLRGGEVHNGDGGPDEA